MSVGEALAIAVSLLFTVGGVVLTLVITLVSILLPVGLMFVIFRMAAQNAAAERELLATGVAAPAKIVSVGETGMYVNDRPQVQLVLEVSPPEGEVFTATVNRVISVLQVPRIQPGQLLEVRFDPSNRSRIAVVGL